MGMLEILLEKAFNLERPENFKELMEAWRESVDKVWVEEFPPPNRDYVFAAVDGSSNKKVFSGYTVYAVGALAIKGKEREEEKVVVGDVGLLKPGEYSEQRINVLMGILETKVALTVAEEVDLLFLDGSLLSMFVRPAVFLWRLDENKKETVEAIFERLKRIYTFSGINSKEFYEELGSLYEGIEYAAACGYLEYLEYLYSFYNLLKNYREKIVAISKRSNSRNYKFDKFHSDATVLNTLLPLKGYTEPVRVSISKEEKFKFPYYFEELLRSFEITVFFFKEAFRPAYKVETFSDVEKVLSGILGFLVDGYFLPLRRVHQDVEIKKEYMEKVVEVLGYRGFTGRESLGS